MATNKEQVTSMLAAMAGGLMAVAYLAVQAVARRWKARSGVA